jgi:hypothetical protein
VTVFRLLPLDSVKNFLNGAAGGKASLTSLPLHIRGLMCHTHTLDGSFVFLQECSAFFMSHVYFCCVSFSVTRRYWFFLGVFHSLLHFFLRRFFSSNSHYFRYPFGDLPRTLLTHCLSIFFVFSPNIEHCGIRLLIFFFSCRFFPHSLNFSVTVTPLRYARCSRSNARAI